MIDRTSAFFAAAGAALSDRRVLLCGISALALALVGTAPTPVLAQMITQGGGNGGDPGNLGKSGPGGIAGGGGGGGGYGGSGGSAATVPGGSALAGGTAIGAGGAPGSPNGLAAGGGGGGAGRLGGVNTPGDGGNGGGNPSDPGLNGIPGAGAANVGGGGGGGGAGGTIIDGMSAVLAPAAGGNGGNGGAGSMTGGGGGGGVGVVLLNGAGFTLSTTTLGAGIISGGDGGDGYTGGGSGAGVFLYDGGTLSHEAGTITGGSGGDAPGTIAGGGGTGVLSNNGVIDNQATITGGQGGAGSSGGAGGAGIEAWGGSIINATTIVGGNGGVSSYGGGFGYGGAGIVFRDGQTAIVTNSGTISGGNGGGGGAGIFGATTGGITIVNGGVINGGLADSGNQANAVTFGGNDNRLELLSGYSFVGNVVAGGGTGNVLALGGAVNAGFDLAQIGAAALFQGFTEFEKTGTGTWTLTGTSAFTGPTSVNEGTLLVNGNLSSSAVTVNSGGILGGNGVLGDVTIASGGTLAPGNSIDTIHAGALSYGAGAIHEVELADSGNSAGTDNDLTIASGVVNIDTGAILHVTPENGTDDGKTYTPGLTYTIITSTSGAATGVAGTFGTVADDYLYLDFTDSYDSHNVYLTSHLAGTTTFCLAGFTVNQCAAAEGTQSLGAGTLFNAIANLTDKAVAGAAFDALSGEIHASGQTVLIDGSHFVADAINDHVRASFAALGQPQDVPLAYAGTGGNAASSAIGGVLAPTPAERFAAWGSAFGAWGHGNSDGNAAGLDSATGGMVAGIDGLVTDTALLGLVAGYTRSGFDAAERASSGHADTYYLGAYGGTEIGALGIRGGASYGWSHIDTARSVAFPGFTDTLNAAYGAGLFQAFGEVSYRFDMPAASFEPFANLTHVSLHANGYTETGGAAALTSAGQTTNATFATLGLRASTAFELGDIEAKAHGTLGWQHAFGDTVPTATHALAGGNAFSVAGSPIARDAAVVEAGLDFTLAPNATLGFSYNGRFGGGAYENGARASLSVKF